MHAHLTTGLACMRESSRLLAVQSVHSSHGADGNKSVADGGEPMADGGEPMADGGEPMADGGEPMADGDESVGREGPLENKKQTSGLVEEMSSKSSCDSSSCARCIQSGRSSHACSSTGALSSGRGALLAQLKMDQPKR
ncbi:hypothetical protein PTTG_30791, partial [Puccinia triticina 1-1 BBBD Race 1]